MTNSLNREDQGIWKAVFLASVQASVISDVDGRILDVNPAAATLFRLPVEALMGQGLGTLFGSPPSGYGNFAQLLNALLEPSGALSVELKFLHASGQEALIRTAGLVITGERGPLLLWSLEDITDLKTSERLLNFFGQTLKSFDISSNFTQVCAQGVRIVIRDLADWCRVDIIKSAELVLVAAAHRNPLLEEELKDLDLRCPPNKDESFSASRTVRSGIADFKPQVNLSDPDSKIESARRAALQSIGLSSYICMPIRVGDQLYGCLTLGRGPGQTPFSGVDLVIAEELAGNFG
jgi:two-component system sensor histidine kinase BarA